MKRTLPLLFLCLIVLLTALVGAGCSATAMDEAQMLELIRSELPLTEADTTPLVVMGRVDSGTQTLLVVQTGGEYNAKSYFPATFRRQGDSYVFEHLARSGMYNCGPDLYSYPWQDGYVFLSMNPDCAAIRIVLDGEEQHIEVTETPFFHHEPDLFVSTDTAEESHVLEYAFLDADGNEL